MNTDNRMTNNFNRNLNHCPDKVSTNSIQTIAVSLPDYDWTETNGFIATSPKSKDKNQKSKQTKQFFITVCGISYVIFLVVFGTILFIGDTMSSQYPLPQAFCILILSIALTYFIFLYIDIRVHLNRSRKAAENRAKHRQLVTENVNRSNDLRTRSASILNLPSSMTTISHKYCFMFGSQNEFVYLKLGAAWFAFGLLIHSVLQIGYQVSFLLSNGNHFYSCASYITLLLDILFPIYSWFTLFFIIKYMNVVINVHQGWARFFFLHAIGTSLCFWVYTIVRETAEAIARTDIEFDASTKNNSLETNQTLIYVYIDCGKYNVPKEIHRQFEPYLYPFIIEYCILTVGVWYMMWSNINNCQRKVNELSTSGIIKSSENELNNLSRPTASCDTEHCRTSTSIQIDCQSSFRGIFAGHVLIILTIVLVILLFVGVENKSYLQTSIAINKIFEIGVLSIMIVASIIAYVRLTSLDVNNRPHLKHDSILLFISIPAFFMETIFSLIPAILTGAVLNICIAVCQTAQALIQTPFIIDGLGRCSNSVELQMSKPGREWIVFLTIANVSLWIFYTFSINKDTIGDERYQFYGYTLWNILSHISLPLIMFYRFHASVCLANIWKHSYEPAQTD